MPTIVLNGEPRPIAEGTSVAVLVAELGLSPQQVDRLREEFAVYLVRSGRMCVAGLNRSNVEATAVAMAAVLSG